MIIIDIIGFTIFLIGCYGFILYLLDILKSYLDIRVSHRYFMDNHSISDIALLKYYIKVILNNGNKIFLFIFVLSLLLLLFSSIEISI